MNCGWSEWKSSGARLHWLITIIPLKHWACPASAVPPSLPEFYLEWVRVEERFRVMQIWLTLNLKMEEESQKQGMWMALKKSWKQISPLGDSSRNSVLSALDFIPWRPRSDFWPTELWDVHIMKIQRQWDKKNGKIGKTVIWRLNSFSESLSIWQ